MEFRGVTSFALRNLSFHDSRLGFSALGAVSEIACTVKIGMSISLGTTEDIKISGTNDLGGLCFYSGGVSNVIFRNHDIRGCDGGSAVSLNSFAVNISIENSLFANNTAPDGGGMLISQHCNNISIVNCNFTNNTAISSGGGLYSKSYNR